MRFHKQTDKINHGACVGRHIRNKNIIGKFRNAWRYHVQVLCTNKLPLYFRKFSQHENFDWYLGAEVQSMRSLVQINFKKLAWKTNCVMLSKILWRYEYLWFQMQSLLISDDTFRYEAVACNILKGFYFS